MSEATRTSGASIPKRGLKNTRSAQYVEKGVRLPQQGQITLSHTAETRRFSGMNQITSLRARLATTGNPSLRGLIRPASIDADAQIEERFIA